MRYAILVLSLWCSCTAATRAAEMRLYPPAISLTGAGATQRLLAAAVDGGQCVGDRTGRAEFSSANPKVALVDAAGVVRAVGDGETVITVTADGMKATATVRVSQGATARVPSFRNDVVPILTRAGCNSGACHGALAGKGGLKLSLRGYDPDADHFALTRQAFGRRLDLREPAQSLLLAKPTRALPHGGGKKLEPGSPDYERILAWVTAGAPAPLPDDPALERVEAFPPAAVLKPQDTLPIVVRAWYADGRAVDVTGWCKFGSTEENVAKVDEAGQVTVAGHGEAAITVLFGSRVAVVPVAAPLPNTLPTDTFAKAPRHNFIDERVLSKLAALRIPPSPPCTDAEFIRRAFLDTAGILPTPEEVRAFVADTRADKRDRLADELLRRPEFVDYWTYKWADLLLVSTRKLPQPAVWAFHQFIRQSVADNKPWDRFAREILTATGSDFVNGAAGYYVLHKDVAELTEATAVTFLGMSITCARCHNHPLEKWTQDQYWGLANLFSRVALKNGDRGGEVLVQALPFGDVPHLRRGVPMPPAPLDGRPLELNDPHDRRAYFAEWLTQPDNPFFARALVNRVWRNFLGRGLVEAEDDLRATNPPSNPELLDALAADFVGHGYDVRRLIRLILTSATYQRSAVPLPGNAGDDRFYSHYLIRRLPAEVILDAYSQVTGVPTPFGQLAQGASGGVANTALYPAGTRALQLPDPLVVSRFLDAFGRPDRTAPCSCERQQDASVGQALHLNNGQTLNDKLRDKQSRVSQWIQEKVSDEEAVRRLFLLALSREPTAREMTQLQTMLAEAGKGPQGGRREVLEDLFWGVLTGREFLFNH